MPTFLVGVEPRHAMVSLNGSVAILGQAYISVSIHLGLPSRARTIEIHAPFAQIASSNWQSLQWSDPDALCDTLFGLLTKIV